MIIPGVDVKDFETIKKQVALVGSSTRLIQIDVADGKLVDGETFLNIVRLNEIQTQAKFDIDLMVENPLKFLEEKIANAIKISMLIDAENYIQDFLGKAKSFGYKVGLSIRPTTDIVKLDPYIDKLDYVQFFAIKPGGSGRPFQVEVLEKIQSFAQKYPRIPIQVDGGIDKDYLALVLKAGATDVIITSHIFGTENPEKALKDLQLAQKYDN